MKISALIAELQKLQALHGDLPVTTDHYCGNDGWTDEVLLLSVDLSNEAYLSNPVGDTLTGSHIHLS